MSKKPHKIEEPKAAYTAKKPAKAAAPASSRRADDTTFKRIADKIFTERKDLLRKLAQ